MAGLGGIISTVLGWLGYQMGQRGDVADASGSLHAKFAAFRSAFTDARAGYLDNNISGRQFDLANSAKTGYYAEDISGSWTTVVSTTGKGIVSLSAHSDTQQNSSVDIVVDGVSLLSTDTFILDAPGSLSFVIGFSTSLLFRIRSTGSVRGQAIVMKY